MVGFRRSLAADNSCHLTNGLLVDSLNGNGDRNCLLGNLKGNALGLGHTELLLGRAVSGEGVTKVQLNGLTDLRCLVSNADDLERLGVALRNTNDHVVQERTGQTVNASVFLLIGRTAHSDLCALLLDDHAFIELVGQGSEGALYGYQVAIGNGNGNACGNGNGHSSNSRHLSIPPTSYQTKASTSPPILVARAFLSVIIPLDVETIAIPNPFITLGISS